LSSTDVRDLLTGKNVEVGGGAGSDYLAISINGTPDDVEEGFRLVHLLLTEPLIEESALKVWKERKAQEIERRRTSVEQQLMEEAQALLSNGDPRFRSLTQEQVEAITLEEGQRWLRRIIETSPIEVAVVGDIERERALELTLKYLGSLPRREGIEGAYQELRQLDHRKGPLTSTVEVETITPRAVVAVGWRGADWTEVKDRRMLQVAAQILTTRLRQEIREKLGLAYSPFCSARAARDYPGTGVLAAYLTTDPGRAAEMARLTRGVIEELAREGPTAAEMEAVHKQFGNIIETSQKEPSYWASVLSELDYRGTRLADVKEAYEKYTTYTGEDVLEVLERYVTEERRIQVAAVPAPRAEAPEEKEPAGAAAAAGAPAR
ncbi:MAG: M16 family metallopeptidase, partial [Planctomycetota bacterium]